MIFIFFALKLGGFYETELNAKSDLIQNVFCLIVKP